jgi:hypothetical protein
MLTTVTLGWDVNELRTLVAGEPVTIREDAPRPIALLPPRIVAAYMSEAGRSVGLIVFRTAPAPDAWRIGVRGVDLPVEFLLEIWGRRRIIRIQRALRFLKRCGIELERPPYGFWSDLSWRAHSRRNPLRIPMVIDLLERYGVISPPNRRSRRWKDMHELLKRARKLREKNAAKAARRDATNARVRRTRSLSGRSHQEPRQGCPEVPAAPLIP